MPAVLVGIVLCLRLAARSHGWLPVCGGLLLLLAVALGLLSRETFSLRRRPVAKMVAVVACRLFVILMVGASFVLEN